jgi:hypothetical protein
MDGEEHFTVLDLISQGFITISDPQQSFLSVPSADISAQIYQCGIHLRLHGVRLRHIRRALDGNGSLIVVPGR